MTNVAVGAPLYLMGQRAGFANPVPWPGAVKQYTSLVGAAASQIGVPTDTGVVYDNNAHANFTYTLPQISVLGQGWRSPLLYVVQTGVITVTANAADKIGAKAVGSSYVSTNAIGNVFQVVSGRGIWLITTAWPQANWS